MIGVSVNEASSSASRMAPTRPSIMSEGATTSAPASTCEIAVRASNSSVGSLRTVPSSTTPQWPWLVYSHRHTSVITSRSGTLSFTARTACCTMPSSAQASEPRGSFSAGIPNSSTAGMPMPAASLHSLISSSTERRCWPGIEPIGSRTPRPCVTNSGYTKSSTARAVSRTILRRSAFSRNRRGRNIGCAITSTTFPTARIPTHLRDGRPILAPHVLTLC